MSFTVQSRPATRILIVRVGAMGDVLHALPAAAALREAMPEAHIGWAIEPQWAPLLRTEDATARDPDRMPLVDAVHLVTAKAWNKRPLSMSTARSIAALRRELRAARYDVAIDLQGTLRSAVIARMSGAESVVGSANPREGMARVLYRTRAPISAIHVVEQAAEIARAADLGLAALTAPVKGASLLPRDSAAAAAWQQQRRSHCGNRSPVLLAATAGWGAKEWPPEKFADLAAALVARGHCVLLNTAPGTIDPATAAVLHRLLQAYPIAVPHVHAMQCTVPQLIEATRDMHAVIAGDTGPLHLAELLGRPTVGLFGPTDPARTGPRDRGVCLRNPGSVTDHRRHAATEVGLTKITVEAVLQALDTVVCP